MIGISSQFILLCVRELCKVDAFDLRTNRGCKMSNFLCSIQKSTFLRVGESPTIGNFEMLQRLPGQLWEVWL